MDLKSLIREIPDFPKKGISFKDITTLLKDKDALRYMVDKMSEPFINKYVEIVVGTEARGFIVGAPIAYKLGAGFVTVRKPNKLPAEVSRIEYSLEYGNDALEIHKDAIKPGQRVLIVDDLLATGGTVKATADLVKSIGGEIVGFAFLVELEDLGGRKRLEGYDVVSLVKY